MMTAVVLAAISGNDVEHLPTISKPCATVL